MSNGLYLGLAVGRLLASAANSPTSKPIAPESFYHPLTGLFAVGVCTLAVWIIRRLANPRKLRLSNTPGRPNRLNLLHIALPFVAMIFALLLASGLLRLRYAPGSLRMAVLAGLIAQPIWLAASLIVAKRAFRHGLRRGLGLSMRHWLYDTGRGLMGYLAVMPLCVLLLWAAQVLIPPEKQPVHDMLLALLELPLGWQLPVLILAAVLAPLAEEIFFRGLVQSALRRYFRSPWLAICIASLAFALVHRPYWHTMPALFVLSIALGYNYERCGRLYPSILMHTIFNAVNIWLFLAREA